MNMWPFIEAEEAQQGNVSRTCQLLEVSRSAFYTHRQHVPSRRSLGDADLTERIIAIHAASKATYGAPPAHGSRTDSFSMLPTAATPVGAGGRAAAATPPGARPDPQQLPRPARGAVP